jgi:hypothetical protein
MNNKIKIAFLIIGFVFFGWLITDFGVGKIIENLKTTGWYFLPIIGTWFFVYLFNAKAWSYIINKPDMSFRSLLSVTISGYALNYMTPFFHLGGEPYRVIALKEELGLNKSVSVTLSYVMLHFLSSFIIWIVASVLILAIVPVSPAVKTALAAGLVVLTGIVGLFIKGYKHGVTKSFVSLLVKLPLPKKLETEIINKEDFTRSVDENLKELFNKRRKSFWAANLFECGSRLVNTFEFYFILQAIGINASITDAFIINAGAGLISNMLFFVPFELGVKEGGLYAVLGFLNFNPATGIYVAIVNRLREMVWILIGLLLITFSGNKLKKNKELLYDESSAV